MKGELSWYEIVSMVILSGMLVFLVIHLIQIWPESNRQAREAQGNVVTYLEREGVKKELALRLAVSSMNNGSHISQLRAEYYSAIVLSVAEKYKVSPYLVTGIIVSESNANNRAVSRKGARGLMQVMPAMGKVYRCGDLFDPEANIECGVRILSDLLLKYHEDAAIKYYLCGESKFHNSCVYGKEAQAYSKKVKQRSKIVGYWPWE